MMIEELSRNEEITSLYLQGDISVRELSNRYNISRARIYALIKRCLVRTSEEEAAQYMSIKALVKGLEK